ncbi:MAG: DUF756 domain-containing protein, partial [Bacteroidetes bacterium]|nr:DUF756 domain-containing protein [Bacteroidota bacterium]
SVGAPFNMSSIHSYKGVKGKSWSYAVKAGDKISDELELADFEAGVYDLRISGPNGFYRQFKGNLDHPEIEVNVYPEIIGIVTKKQYGNLVFSMENKGVLDLKFILKDNKYQATDQLVKVKGKSSKEIKLNVSKHANWYDFSLLVEGYSLFEQRYAGKIETGEITTTDPFMGGIVG